MKKYRNVIIEISIFIIFVFIGVFGYMCSAKDIYIKLDGEAEITMDVFSEYHEKGVKVEYCGKYIKFKCITIDDVKINSNLNTDVVGEYTISYEATYKGKNRKIQKRIKVEDNEAPVINLNDDTKSYVCPNKEYKEAGYKVIDNYDKNLDDKVIITKLDNGIKYSVVDSSGNEATAFREFKYDDLVKPTISLDGYSTVYLEIGKEYVEKGYTASDNCDGDITSKVKVSNNINVNKTGTYYIEYSVKDAKNNSTTVKRTVIIYDKNAVKDANKIVYLTFDDGPCVHTKKLLDILDEYNVKVTFFVTNQFSNYTYLIKEEYDRGHSIGLHTSSHNFKNIYSSENAYFNDLNSINNIVYKYINKYSDLIRFPGGSSNTVSGFNKGIMTRLVKSVTEKGYAYFDWNVESKDTSTTNSNTIANNVISGIKNKKVSVVLQHDIKPASIEATKQIIEYGLANGYTFLPLNHDSPSAHHGINN